MTEPQDAGKYQVSNEKTVQGQVIGDHNTVHQQWITQHIHDVKDKVASTKLHLLFTLASALIIALALSGSSFYTPLKPVRRVRLWPTKISQVQIFVAKTDDSKIIGYIDSPGWITVYCQDTGKSMRYDDEITKEPNTSSWWSETRTSNGTLGWISNVYIKGHQKLMNVSVCSSNQT